MSSILRRALSAVALSVILVGSLASTIRSETPLVPAPKLPPPANATTGPDGTIYYPCGTILYPDGTYVLPDGTVGYLP